jgi:hypothetical protein
MAATAIVAETGGRRLVISLDRGHRLEIKPPGGPSTVIEPRPVTEFAAAVDPGGKLHVAAWLLSRQLMYYTSADGEAFTRSTLLKSDGVLRLRDPLLFAGAEGTAVVYVAETEYADTLVCYRWDGRDWDGSRLVETEHPQRLSAYQFDGAPGALSALYGVRDTGRTVVTARPLSGDQAPEVVAAVSGGLTDFCALTSGGARQACWISDGRLTVNGLRQSDEPWSRTWPHFRREEGGLQCLWMEDGMLAGFTLGAQRARLHPVTVRVPLPCMLALPGETRKSVVDGATLKEIALFPELSDRQAAQRLSPQPSPDRPDGARRKSADVTLTDIVHNQAVYLTRMQESLGAMERNMLRVQAEVNKLNREVAALMSEMETRRKAKPSQSQFSIAAVRREKEPEAEKHEEITSDNEEDIIDELSEQTDIAEPEEAPETATEDEPEEGEAPELPEDFPVS